MYFLFFFFYNEFIVFWRTVQMVSFHQHVFYWWASPKKKIDGCLWNRWKTAQYWFTQGDQVFFSCTLMCSLRQIWPTAEYITVIHIMCACVHMYMHGRLIAHHISCHGVNVTSVAHNDERNHVVGSSSAVFHGNVCHTHTHEKEKKSQVKRKKSLES